MEHMKFILLFLCVGMHAGFPQQPNSVTMKDTAGTTVPDDELEEFKYMAVITNENKTIVYCSAFILSPSWTLTAAHCEEQFETKSSTKFITIVGKQYLRETISLTFKRHPYYNPTTGINDIAVLEVYPPIEFGDTEGTIPIMKNAVEEGTKCKVIGFEYVEQKPLMQYSEVIIYKNCTNMPDGQICSLHNNQWEGNEGSPVVCNNELAGFRVSDNSTNYDFYTDVSKYKEWIDAETSAGVIFFISPLTILATFTILKMINILFE